MPKSKLAKVIEGHEADVLKQWLKSQQAAAGVTGVDDAQRKQDSEAFLKHFVTALRSGATDVYGPEWSDMRQLLSDMSRSRARLGSGPSQTASFIFALKRPLFMRLQAEIGDAAEVADELWRCTELLDQLGLYTTEVFQKSREDMISRQQQELLELSTPVTRLWEGILAVPLIGTLDSARTQVVMESLLEEIVNTGASIAVMDITGVPAVDTLVAQHLLKTVAAARLMGAECVISGIRPQIAQTVVHLGVDLGDVVTKSTLADAFRYALSKHGYRVVAAAGASST